MTSHLFASQGTHGALTSDRIEYIFYQLSEAITSAINGTHTQRTFIPRMLHDLIKLENRPVCLTEVVYKWCSAICENHQSLWDWEDLLLVCLEIGFRHLDPRNLDIATRLTHTEHHRQLVNVVFGSQKSEAIADLLHAWTTRDNSLKPARTLLSSCTGHLISLHTLAPFSPRLRQLAIRSIELIGYKGFEGVGVDRFVELLNHFHVTVEDMDRKHNWELLLLDALQSPEGAQHLSHWYWELLVELTTLESLWLEGAIAYSPQVMTFLTEAQEWSKLECWIGIVWMVWPPGAGGATEGDLIHSMLLLFKQQPGAVWKLKQWMEQWSQQPTNNIPESFQKICDQVCDAAQ